MSAAEALQAAQNAGVAIGIDGDDLVLEASAPPPAAVLDLLPGDCSPAVTAIGLPMRASRNRSISAGLGNHKRSECGWAEARTCLRGFRRNPRACTGEPMSNGAASMMLPKSDQPLA
jgi:hypothetical protein